MLSREEIKNLSLEEKKIYQNKLNNARQKRLKEKNPQKYKEDHKKYQSKYRSTNLEVLQSREKIKAKAYRDEQKKLLTVARVLNSIIDDVVTTVSSESSSRPNSEQNSQDLDSTQEDSAT